MLSRNFNLRKVQKLCRTWKSRKCRSLEKTCSDVYSRKENLLLYFWKPKYVSTRKSKIRISHGACFMISCKTDLTSFCTSCEAYSNLETAITRHVLISHYVACKILGEACRFYNNSFILRSESLTWTEQSTSKMSALEKQKTLMRQEKQPEIVKKHLYSAQCLWIKHSVLTIFTAS